METTQGALEVKLAINCTGLYSDRFPKLSKVDPKAKIVLFRREYYELKPEKWYLVKQTL